MLNWKQENNGKWFCYKDDGTKVTGWISDEKDLWYHLNDKDASLDTGFFQTATDNDFWFYAYPNQVKDNDGTVLHVVGEMAINWIKDKNTWYYLCPNKITNYNITYPCGAMITNWLQINQKWYYFLESTDASKGEYKGQMVTGIRTINGKDYNFNTDGSLIEDSNEGLSDKGAEFIASWEGFSSTWEDVGDGWMTIGIGTATSGTLGKQLYDSGITSCTREDAYKWLEEECASCYEAIKSKLDTNNITLSTNQVDALISMSYNIGQDGLLGSTLFSNILNGVIDEATIRSGFEAWDKCNGVVWDGLKKRRDSECSLYLYADYTGNN